MYVFIYMHMDIYINVYTYIGVSLSRVSALHLSCSLSLSLPPYPPPALSPTLALTRLWVEQGSLSLSLSVPPSLPASFSLSCSLSYSGSGRAGHAGHIDSEPVRHFVARRCAGQRRRDSRLRAHRRGRCAEHPALFCRSEQRGRWVGGSKLHAKLHGSAGQLCRDCALAGTRPVLRWTGLAL